MEQEQINNDVILNETLREWKVCWICRIRLLQRNFDFEMLKNCPLSETWTCYLCCGILQTKGLSNEVIDQIVTDIKCSNYNFDSFEITISTPANLIIREFVVWHSLKSMYKDSLSEMNLDSITTVKAVWKWSVKTIVAKSLDKTYLNGCEAKDTRVINNKAIENDIISVAVSFNHDKFEAECTVLGELEPSLFQRRRRGEKRYNWEVFTRKTVIQVLQRATVDTLARYFRMPPNHISDTSIATVLVNVSRPDPILIGGRYIKSSRRLPQSPWIFDGVRKLEGSVEESITEKLITAAQAESTVFMASGREDVDVRMLGHGRPFVVELRNCKNMSLDLTRCMQDLENSINESSQGILSVNRLSIVSRDSVNLIKKGEEEKSKQYRAVIFCEQGLSSDGRELTVVNNTKDLITKQWTPIRVLHRRSLIERPRTFYSLAANRLDSVLTEEAIANDNSLADYTRFLESHDRDHLFLLHLRCQAGSYIKEFVHGDLGRTRPNLGTLMGQGCDILALDVMEIELDWPLSKK